MNSKTCIPLTLLLLAGCATVPWQSRTFSDHESIGRVLFDQIEKLEAGKLKPIDLVPSLQDKRVLFVDDDGQRITVRDIAFGILDEAGIKGLPPGATPVVICGCKVDGEWYRFHVPRLTDEGFDKAIETIQQGGGHVR